MCGIFFALVQKSDENNFDINNIDFDLLNKRGPNSFDILKLNINDSYTLYFAASVLSLRGIDCIVKQPIYDQEGLINNILLWNGEIYSSNLLNIDNTKDNDGLVLYKKLCENIHDDNLLISLLSSIKGPYSFLFYSNITKKLYYGRDHIGRRSLLVHMPKFDLDDSLFMLSSVRVFHKNLNKKQFDFDEVKSNGIYKLDLNETFSSVDKLRLIEWPDNIVIPLFNENLNDHFDENKFNEIYEQFIELLKQSMIRRLNPLPKYCKDCFELHKKLSKFDVVDDNNTKCTHAKVALLFSGGLDSAVLAALMDQVMPADETIDLLNVAFEQSCQDPNKIYQVPDRVSGLQTLSELNSKRNWNFVEINVTKNELKECRDNCIKNLLYPLDTVLDDSIGCALWFASRGLGTVNSTAYKSNAEIILLGIGADEQLGGYARHRTRFRVDGAKGLIDELKLEMKRISERNLGRDDRILSYHGKESRLPYLDEDLINFLNELDIIYKCNLNLPKGVGDKYLLRHYAQNLGLTYASKLAKRAIQFGSRVAKLESSKEKASDKCSRLNHNDED